VDFALEHFTDGLQRNLVEIATGDLVLTSIALGRDDDARALLDHLAGEEMLSEGTDRLPALVRGALALGDAALAGRLCGSIRPLWPLPQARLAAARAALAEAGGDLDLAASAYADSAGRWRTLGARLEQGYALLGHGRCLAALGSPAAEAVLLGARTLFADIGAHARVEDCDAVLARVTRLTS
jgi:hypothetical protein